MEFIWRKGVGMKIAVAPRSLLVFGSVGLAVYAPNYLPQWLTIFRAVVKGF